MSNSARPHRRQPTRLPRPWDSPGKNTGVGYHFLLRCMKVKSESEVAQSYPTQRPHGLQPTRLLRPWDFPGTSTGVGCHISKCSVSFRMEIFFLSTNLHPKQLWCYFIIRIKRWFVSMQPVFNFINSIIWKFIAINNKPVIHNWRK